MAHADAQARFSVAVSLDGRDVAEVRSVVAAELTFEIENPQLWWPAGQGAQPLYSVNIELLNAQNAAIDTLQGRIGLRTIVLDQADDALAQAATESNRKALLADPVRQQDYLKLFLGAIPQALAEVDPETPYLHSSPAMPLPGDHPQIQLPSHDAHDWEVWHSRKPVEHYETTRHRSVSEFGIQSYPSLPVAQSFCPPEQLDIASPVFQNHQKAPRMMDLRPSQVEVSVQPAGPDCRNLHLSNSDFVYAVSLEFAPEGISLSDNAFDLYPGEARVVRVERIVGCCAAPTPTKANLLQLHREIPSCDIY